MAARIFPPAFEPLGNGYTRAEVSRMEESGELSGRWELIEGQLVNKMGQNPPHVRGLGRVYGWLLRVFGEARVRNQAPIEVAIGDRERNEPQPDLAVVAEDKLEYDQRHPCGEELVLIVEVSDTSSRFDLTVKAALYARAGVPEYWVLNVVRRTLAIHRGPENGRYLETEELAEDQSVPLNEANTLVSDLLPRASQ